MTDIADGDVVEFSSSSGRTYELKNIGGVYSCSCPAWRNQSVSIETRTCKHLKAYRGEDAEVARCGEAAKSPRKKPGSKAKKDGPPILLAENWDNAMDVAGWWMSEKLDGVRAFWDGRQFISRQGNVYHAPDWFCEALPESPLDGELWLDRGAFQKTVSIVRRLDRSDHWKQIKYLVFDAPEMDAPFEDRIGHLDETIGSLGSAFVEALAHEVCEGMEHLERELARVEGLGGEGLMLRQPGSKYAKGRSMTLLKVKTFHDAEATVVGHTKGTGRHKGRVGALEVEAADGTRFKVGTGLSDKQRDDPPPIGVTITYRYQELTDGGVPRFPSFLRVRDDEPVAAKKSKPSGSKKTPSKKAKKAKKPAAKKPAAQKQSAPAAPIAGARYFEFSDGKSNKFWEVAVDDCDVTVRYGRIGANGQTKTKSFADASKAVAHAEKLIGEKTGKGYVETEKD